MSDQDPGAGGGPWQAPNESNTASDLDWPDQSLASDAGDPSMPPPPQPQVQQWSGYPDSSGSPGSPGYAGGPSGAPAPWQPGQQGYTGYLVYPGQPSGPLGAPGYPGQPSGPGPQLQPPSAYPQPPYATGAPSVPLAPGQYPTGYPAPAYPGYPGYSGYSGYPSYSGYPGYPGYGQPSQALPGSLVPMPAPSYVPYPGYEMPLEPEESALARPFTMGTSILLFVGSIAACLGIAAVVMAAGHADWSAGATAAGITALILAFVALVVALARILLGRRARVMYALSAAMVLALMVTGLGSLSVANPLHTLQAHSLEHDGQWAGAIREYSYAGQGAPNAPDIARVYDEWGEQLLGQHSYGLAANRFQTVVAQYHQSGDAYERGRTDLYDTYKQWVVTGGTDVPYSDAIAYFGTYASASTCDTYCQTDAQNIEAQARFQYGTQLAASSDYAGAVTQFEAVQSRFPHSVYAPQAHAAAAKAYLAEGQAAIKAGTCASALPLYQTLAAKYGDTSEGKQAKSALDAGVDVTGSIGNLPTNPRPTLFLSKHINPNSFYFSSEYTSSPGTNGSFTFHGVKPGDYNLASSYDLGNTINYVWWHDPSNNAYFIHVGQLCPVQVTDLQNYP